MVLDSILLTAVSYACYAKCSIDQPQAISSSIRLVVEKCSARNDIDVFCA